MNVPLLQIQNLAVDFKTETGITCALKGISFNIFEGETVAVVGESGSGKTVTSLSILQLLPAPPAIYANGSILFKEAGKEAVNLLQVSKSDLRRIRGNKISMIFQEPMTSLNPVKTCGDQVIEAIRIHEAIDYNSALQRCVRLFEKVKLPHPQQMVKRYPHQLSGGQKQRVMIAMAISCEPLLLIADEPTTALDVTVQKTILELIKDIQLDSNMGVVYITHDLELVSEIADRVVVMFRGDIVETGPTREIFSNPKHPYTRALLNCRPHPDSKGKKLPVISDFLQDEDSDVKITPATPEEKRRHQPIHTSSDILKVEDLQVYFPTKKSLLGKTKAVFKAIDGISFCVKQGETLGLVGESGCGKTTLGRTLLRLIEPTGGNIIFNGKNLSAIPTRRMRNMRKEMQIIFQDPFGSLNPRLTIGEAIAEPIKIHEVITDRKLRKEKVVDLLEKVNLHPDYYNRYPHEFSGGQRQRICIARALGLNPDFIICDESVSALDVSVQAQVLNLFNELKAELGFTCIFISHNLTVVHYISDRIMVMNKGKIEEQGTADQIYFHPRKPYTRKLIESIPAFSGW